MRRKKKGKRHSDISSIMSLDTSVYSDNKTIREIYEESQLYWKEELPIELRESSIKRELVNHIRHQYTKYNADIKKVNRLIKNSNYDESIYRQYKNMILYSISVKYPFLRSECINQGYNVNMVKYI